MNCDIAIVGAGPAGLSFARSLKNSGLNLLLIEQSSLQAIREPAPDGREIALTHRSVRQLRQLGAWARIPRQTISSIETAKVLDGTSPCSLDFYSRNGDALGYLAPNYRIRRALYEEVKAQHNLRLLTGISVDHLRTDRYGGIVSLSNGTDYRAKLIVAADSRFSTMRRSMGIGASMRDFGKTAIVCRMAHERPHEQTAFECFHYGRTLAVLPLPKRLSSIVITIDNERADAIIGMNEAQFNADIDQQFRHRLGRMKLIGERHAYPLVAVHADRFAANRFALIGDAAVGMHPVTAHGFNLGIEGQAILARQIGMARSRGLDIGSRYVLTRYEAKHMRTTRLMYRGTNGIVGLFTDDRPPARFARRAMLRLANRFTPIRHAISARLTETGQEELPR